jgi:hypothetical protein
MDNDITQFFLGLLIFSVIGSIAGYVVSLIALSLFDELDQGIGNAPPPSEGHFSSLWDTMLEIFTNGYTLMGLVSSDALYVLVIWPKMMSR